jgi:hypothetical protein
MKKNLLIVVTALIILWNFKAYAFEGNTHKALTEKAISNNNQSVLDNYIKDELGMGQGLNSVLVLDGEITPDSGRVLPQIPASPSILDLLKAGAYLEDVPNPRARHHFHDPYRNAGLDNKTEHPVWADRLDQLSMLRYGLSFDLTGASALKRALGTEGSQWETEYENYFAWPDTRDYFYKAFTQESEAEREHYLALTFLSLGHVSHLLEDMGVPPHARNDFIEAHFRVPKGLWGNPFETYVEDETGTSGIPARWLDGWSPQAKVFSKLVDYWDIGDYTGQYVGTSPLSNWGLSERTNYQFLSQSTIFRENDGTLYYFPQPDVNNVTGYIKPGVYTWDSNLVNYRYISGYDITHLARTKYIEKYAYAAGMPYPVPMGTVVYHTTFDKYVYEDYAKVTIPRTIDYATGLTNYFFRGWIQLRSCVTLDWDILRKVKLYITNKSMLGDSQFAFKGGTFEVYWDDAEGYRHQIQAFTTSKVWNAGSTLEYDEEMWIEFNDEVEHYWDNAERFIVVYKGNIIKQPELAIDEDDTEAIAVSISEPTCPLPLCYKPIPKQIQVEFSGINLCNCVQDGSGNGLRWIGNLDVTRILPHYYIEGFGHFAGWNWCSWTDSYRKTNPVTITRIKYEFGDCTGSFISEYVDLYPYVLRYDYPERGYPDYYEVVLKSFDGHKVFFSSHGPYSGSEVVGGVYQNLKQLGDCGELGDHGYAVGYGGQCVITELYED